MYRYTTVTKSQSRYLSNNNPNSTKERKQDTGGQSTTGNRPNKIHENPKGNKMKEDQLHHSGRRKHYWIP
jgi:hypothetical protein